jgi:hypothetical protein
MLKSSVKNVGMRASKVKIHEERVGTESEDKPVPNPDEFKMLARS